MTEDFGRLDDQRTEIDGHLRVDQHFPVPGRPVQTKLDLRVIVRTVYTRVVFFVVQSVYLLFIDVDFKEVFNDDLPCHNDDKVSVDRKVQRHSGTSDTNGVYSVHQNFRLRLVKVDNKEDNVVNPGVLLHSVEVENEGDLVVHPSFKRDCVKTHDNEVFVINWKVWPNSCDINSGVLFNNDNIMSIVTGTVIFRRLV